MSSYHRVLTDSGDNICQHSAHAQQMSGQEFNFIIFTYSS